MRGSQGNRKRRVSAIDQREVQLKAGTKPEKVDKRTTDKQIPLTDKDVKRIKSEIEVLKKRT